MKKVVGLLKEAGVEQRSRVKEAVQTALQDGSLQASAESRAPTSPHAPGLCTLPPSRSPCFTQLHLRTGSTEPEPEPEP